MHIEYKNTILFADKKNQCGYEVSNTINKSRASTESTTTKT